MLQRIDTDALKRSRPISEVVASYGIELRSSGRTLVGRCPFHTDSGRPNLYVYPTTESFYCFRCGIGGDAITFVERIEGIDFLEAVTRLCGAEQPSPGAVVPRPPPPGVSPINVLGRRGVDLSRRRRRAVPQPTADGLPCAGLRRATRSGTGDASRSVKSGYAAGDELGRLSSLATGSRSGRRCGSDSFVTAVTS